MWSLLTRNTILTNACDGDHEGGQSDLGKMMNVWTVETPLTAQDACCILAIDRIEYELALANGHLHRSIQLDADPTGRFAFHNFWDVLGFELYRSLGSLDEAAALEVEDALDRLATRLCGFSSLAAAPCIASLDGIHTQHMTWADLVRPADVLADLDEWVTSWAWRVADTTTKRLASVMAHHLPTSQIQQAANSTLQPRSVGSGADGAAAA